MAERRAGDVERGDVERYEQLRARVLAGDAAGFRLGLGVLHHRGVAGWLHAWRSPAAAATDSTIGAAGTPTGRARPGGPPLGGSAAVPAGAAAEELVGVLAGMTLACLGGGDRW